MCFNAVLTSLIVDVNVIAYRREHPAKSKRIISKNWSSDSNVSKSQMRIGLSSWSGRISNSAIIYSKSIRNYKAFKPRSRIFLMRQLSIQAQRWVSSQMNEGSMLKTNSRRIYQSVIRLDAIQLQFTMSHPLPFKQWETIFRIQEMPHTVDFSKIGQMQQVVRGSPTLHSRCHTRRAAEYVLPKCHSSQTHRLQRQNYAAQQDKSYMASIYPRIFTLSLRWPIT